MNVVFNTYEIRKEVLCVETVVHVPYIGKVGTEGLSGDFNFRTRLIWHEIV